MTMSRTASKLRSASSGSTRLCSSKVIAPWVAHQNRAQDSPGSIRLITPWAMAYSCIELPTSYTAAKCSATSGEFVPCRLRKIAW